jgi:uncharacterized membrane protein
MTTPPWVLSIAYWLHMLATVLWVGGLAVFSLLVRPLAQKKLDQRSYSDLLIDYRRKLDPLGWFSILLLLASGLFQMSASEHYQGFLSINSLWAGAILIKHLLFGLMVTISGYVTWIVMPALRRSALRKASGKEAPELPHHQQRSVRLMYFNLVLGILVLLLTAIARSA